MPSLTLPAVLGAMSRRGLALLAAGLLVVTGAFATIASTVMDSPEASMQPAASPAPGSPTSSAESVSPPPEVTASAEAAEAAVTTSDNAGGAGGNNLVMINNYRDGSLRMKGSIQINRINAPNVAPQNLARSYASCTDCDTLAVAMQINLIRRDTNRVVPANAAVAINVACTRCRTIAVALQYTLSVDDPMDTPPDVRRLVRDMDAELRDISRTAPDLAAAIERINAVIARYATLTASLDDQRDEATESTTEGAVEESGPPTPTPTPTPIAPSASPAATAEPSVEATATPIPSLSESSTSPMPSP